MTMNTPQPIPTPRHDQLLYEEACNFDVGWSEEFRQLERELFIAKQAPTITNADLVEGYEQRQQLAKWKTLATLAMEFVHNGPVKLYREFKELKGE